MSKISDLCWGKRNEELFVAAVDFLSKKYKIGDYTLITKSAWHLSAESDADLEVKKELSKIFRK